MESKKKSITIIGGGLAGSEAAYFLLKRGYDVTLYERRPEVNDGAHETSLLGELVCSNSLKSKRLDNACGLLKEEMHNLGSIVVESALHNEVPSGNALSVDRDLFAKEVTAKLASFPNFHLVNKEIDVFPQEDFILATGPLTNGLLLDELARVIGGKNFSFFDASAPIVEKDSIDFSIAYYKSRFEQDDGAYINCPFTKEEYFKFVDELTHAEKALLHEFDTHYFEGCLPIEVIASRGIETLRHGPMKPFGLYQDGKPKPYAVVQLRQDDKLGDYYNLVGFQTNLTYPEQRRVFSMIPGLANAKFLRYGLMHRNSYINAPTALNPDLSLENLPNCYIAGQLSGVEGYVESAATGILAAMNYARKAEGKDFLPFPRETVLGSLVDYLLGASPKNFMPMNANWAIVPGAKKENRQASIDLSLKAVKEYLLAYNE